MPKIAKKANYLSTFIEDLKEALSLDLNRDTLSDTR